MHTSVRRRSSRTSSFFLPSATEVHPLRALKNKMCPDLGRDTVVEDMSAINNRYVVCTMHNYTFRPQDELGSKHSCTFCPCSCTWSHNDDLHCHCACSTDTDDDDKVKSRHEHVIER